MSDVEIMKQAARLMRERAEAAASGSWTLLVANWLDNAADRAPYAGRETPELSHAVTIARAYLGGAS